MEIVINNIGKKWTVNGKKYSELRGNEKLKTDKLLKETRLETLVKNG